MRKNVVWVHRFPHTASYRYRAEIPSKTVGTINGFQTALNDGEADIVVFSKPMGEDYETAVKAKSEGAKIVVDFADDHFQRDDAYFRFAELADQIVTASPVMRGRIYDYIKRDATVISDPYEFDECEPHADGDNFLWFGHVRNWQEVTTAVGHMGTRKLRVVSGPNPIPSVIPWSLENMKEAFKVSNIVILPTQAGADYKSPNRLVNSIRSGCFAVCMDHPAYKEFRDFVWVGNFPTGLKWTDAFKDRLNDCVKAGQEYVREKYSPATIGKQWASFLEAV